jgi:hypothetical protein
MQALACTALHVEASCLPNWLLQIGHDLSRIPGGVAAAMAGMWGLFVGLQVRPGLRAAARLLAPAVYRMHLTLVAPRVRLHTSRPGE